jgi:RNA polymerase primary sigma factor
LVQEYGREPTPDEVAEEMNLPVERVQRHHEDGPAAHLAAVARSATAMTPTSATSSRTRSAENPYDMTAYSLLREKLKDVLDTLTERERRVLTLRFGLVDGYSRTLEEVGKQFNVTRERIRQIEAKALRKMRHPTRMRQLHGFFDAEQNLLKQAQAGQIKPPPVLPR